MSIMPAGPEPTPRPHQGRPRAAHGAPPAYGAPPAAYGAPPAAYGGPPAAHGGPPAAYGAPPGAHGAPPGAYGAPSAVHGGPPATYGGPPAAYGGPTASPGRPGVLTAACIVVWVLSALTVLNAVQAIQYSYDLQARLGGDTVNDVPIIAGGIIALAVVLSAGAIVMFRGSNAARVVVTVLMGIGFLAGAAALTQGAVLHAVPFLLLAVGVLVVVFVWQLSVTAYMRRRKA